MKFQQAFGIIEDGIITSVEKSQLTQLLERARNVVEAAESFIACHDHTDMEKRGKLQSALEDFRQI